MTNQTCSSAIRTAIAEDLPAILEIHNHYILNSTATFDIQAQTIDQKISWFANQKEQQLPVFVLEAQDKILGFASLSNFQASCAFRLTAEPSIYLASANCGNGFGKQLMNRLMTAAQDKGYHAIVALVCAENSASLSLAKGFGFRLVGELKEVAFKFDRWLDLSILQKVL